MDFIQQSNNFYSITKNKLSKWFININYFNKILNNNCIISGSFIIELLLNDNYNNNDLDIYTNSNNLYKLLEYLKIEKYDIYYKKRNNIDYRLHINNNIKHVYYFINKKKNTYIDIILCNNPTETVKYFDLKICKNYYNGKNIFVLYPCIIQKKVENIDNTDYDNIYKISYTKNRMNKYISRGFKFIIDKNSKILDSIIFINNKFELLKN